MSRRVDGREIALRAEVIKRRIESEHKALESMTLAASKATEAVKRFGIAASRAMHKIHNERELPAITTENEPLHTEIEWTARERLTYSNESEYLDLTSYTDPLGRVVRIR